MIALEAITSIFLVQSHGLDSDLLKLIIIHVTATMASIGTAEIPQVTGIVDHFSRRDFQ